MQSTDALTRLALDLSWSWNHQRAVDENGMGRMVRAIEPLGASSTSFGRRLR
jgi:hypothetical protein